MEYLRVKKWDEFQHYSKRNPPWIKLYNTLLDDFDFMRLGEKDQARLFKIWLLASRTNNRIPRDNEFLRARLGANGDFDVENFVSGGWLVPYKNASNTLAGRLQDARPSREEESRAEKKRAREASKFKGFWDHEHPRADLARLGGAAGEADERALLLLACCAQRNFPGANRPEEIVLRQLAEARDLAARYDGATLAKAFYGATFTFPHASPDDVHRSTNAPLWPKHLQARLEDFTVEADRRAETEKKRLTKRVVYGGGE